MLPMLKGLPLKASHPDGQGKFIES
jgi:hypothetical protein